MSSPAFAVIIPAYNERDLVPHTIRSVQAQTREDWEAVVVDDGSTDDTADVVRRAIEGDARFRLISKENGGLAAARNTGVEATTAPLLSWVDSDDMWLPGYLEVMGAALEAAPRAGWAYTDAWALDVDRDRFRRATAMSACQPPEVLPEDPAEVMKLLIRQNFIWVSATVRRRAFVEAGGFDPEMRLTEDIELWLRILALGYTVVRTPGVLGIKRERAGALSRQDLNNVVSLQLVFGRVAANETLPADVRAAAAARIESLERWRLALSGESRALAAGLAVRRALGSVRRATTGRRDWLREPPAEVQAAFPELGRG